VHQVDAHQLDILFIDKDGALNVSWVIDGGTWQGPVGISPTGVAPKGAPLAAAHQTTDAQLDVVCIGNDGALNVSWVNDGGTWQGPVNVSGGFHLNPIERDHHFFPFTYTDEGGPHTIPGDGTPTGAFSYDRHVFVAFFHGVSADNFFSGLSVTDDPFAARPYELLFKVSTPAESRFFQIAPWVINNAEYGSALPTSEGDGLILFGHGWNPRENAHGVHLAWLPLRPGTMPSRNDIRYYVRDRSPSWSSDQNDATLFFSTENWSSISVGRIAATGQWIFLNQTCGGRGFTQSFLGPIVARVAGAPWWIMDATPIELFNPVRDNALGRYMWNAGFPDINHLAASAPTIDHPGFAYGAYLLNHYTTYDTAHDVATITYLMSTGKPYQVQVMRSSITDLR
jgi:hypothetical protein